MMLNDALPEIEVNPETYEVRADGELLTCEPARCCRWRSATSCSEAWASHAVANRRGGVAAGLALSAMAAMADKRGLPRVEPRAGRIAYLGCQKS